MWVPSKMIIYGKLLSMRSFKTATLKLRALWVSSVHTGVDRHQQRNIDRLSHPRTDQHILSSIDRHLLWNQLHRARQRGSWLRKSLQLDTLIHPNPTVLPQKISIENISLVRGFLCRIFVSTTEGWTRLVFCISLQVIRLKETFY